MSNAPSLSREDRAAIREAIHRWSVVTGLGLEKHTRIDIKLLARAYHAVTPMRERARVAVWLDSETPGWR